MSKRNFLSFSLSTGGRDFLIIVSEDGDLSSMIKEVYFLQVSNSLFITKISFMIITSDGSIEPV